MEIPNSSRVVSDKSMQAVYSMSFLVAFGGTIVGTCIPLFVRLQGAGDFLTSLVQSASSIIYIVTPLLLSPFVRRFGLQKSVIFATGIALINVLIYFTFWSLFTPSLFLIVIGTFFVTHVVDGFWTGLFWPAVESRISDEKRVMPNPLEYEVHVRRYNLGWNAGVAASYACLIVATLPPTKEQIIAGLFIIFIIGAVSFV
ncbi:MAG TPA: hypothetical protein VKK79_08380, partial [Candidatus Lokiarchaeia archaeon]|nr:hypothetical protein [Candidatus Lokiarchaeia archaeon]